MADINVSYVYQDGQILIPDSHNKNIYDGSLPTPNGIMSTANGGLSANNLKSTFKVQPEHIQTEQVAITRSEGTRVRIDCFADAFSRGEGTSSATVANAPIGLWTAIPGHGLRFYQPYAASVVMWQWSMYLLPSRITMLHQQGITNEDTYTDIKENCAIGIAAMLDGSLLDHTRRATKGKLIMRDPAEYKGIAAHTYGGRTADWWDMHHLATNVSQGWHDIQLMVYMESFLNHNTYQEYTPIRNGKSLTNGGKIRLSGRITFGIRNARVLTLL